MSYHEKILSKQAGQSIDPASQHETRQKDDRHYITPGHIYTLSVMDVAPAA